VSAIPSEFQAPTLGGKFEQEALVFLLEAPELMGETSGRKSSPTFAEMLDRVGRENSEQ
jgi:hypothetical protein